MQCTVLHTHTTYNGGNGLLTHDNVITRSSIKTPGSILDLIYRRRPALPESLRVVITHLSEDGALDTGPGH